MNSSNVDCRFLLAERTSTMDSLQREFDNFSRTKSPIAAAFLSPLAVSISVFRQSLETVSSGVIPGEAMFQCCKCKFFISFFEES